MAPEERRKAIIESVVPLLIRHGADVTTRQIAEAAGIAEGTIFRVFPDKRALLLATAAETINPPGSREAVATAMRDLPDLRDKVLFITEQMMERLERGMLVMMALRSLLMSGEARPHEPPGPPAFIADSNRTLLETLTDEVFTPHADELGVPPERAARVLRNLTLGTWHPGKPEDDRLSTEEIADACLHGVASSKERRA
jgi:AcrR family transcriptional regulator